mgnify:CR=1 FL=1
MKHLQSMFKKTAVAVTGASAVVVSSVSQAAFDPLTIATEKADFISNLEVGILLGVTFTLLGAGGIVIMKFIKRGAN